MLTQFEAASELTISDITYRIAEHPSAPGLPYGQEGRQAVVYLLLSEESQVAKALKVFRSRYSVPSMVGLTEKLQAFANFPGLQVCQRTVLTPQQNPTLLKENRDLLYAVLMPWIKGPSWWEVMLNRDVLSPEQSLNLARALTQILLNLEQNGIAHCDLSAPNIMLPVLEEGTFKKPDLTPVELVDLEQLLGPGLERPAVVPSGSPGYAHPSATMGLWQAEADRFAGAVLIAEMLCWCDEEVRKEAWGESYFDPTEMQQKKPRYLRLVHTLEKCWGSDVARLFEQAWNSPTLSDCPTFGEWTLTLPDKVPEVQANSGEGTPLIEANSQIFTNLTEQKVLTNKFGRRAKTARISSATQPGKKETASHAGLSGSAFVTGEGKPGFSEEVSGFEQGLAEELGMAPRRNHKVLGYGVAAGLLIVAALGLLLLISPWYKPSVPVVEAQTTAVQTTAVPTITTLPTAIPTTLPTVTALAPTPVLTATPMPTATSTPVLSTSTPVPTLTIAPSATPGPHLVVHGVGTSRRGNTEIVEPADAASEFKVGDEVFGYIHYGDARPDLDTIKVTVLLNNAPIDEKPFTLVKPTVFFVFSLGKLGAGNYKLEVRYNDGLVSNQPEFKVNPSGITPSNGGVPTQSQAKTQAPVVRTQPTSTPVQQRQPTATPVPQQQTVQVPQQQPTATPVPQQQQPTPVPQPTATPVPQPTATPVPPQPPTATPVPPKPPTATPVPPKPPTATPVPPKPPTPVQQPTPACVYNPVTGRYDCQ